MLKRGFDAVMTVKGSGAGATAKKVVTRGDITISSSHTEIEVKNAASNEVRYIPGMESTEFSVTVQAGVDPEDAAGYDAYDELKGFYEAGEIFEVTFTSPGGFTRTKNMIVTTWKDSDPVDDVNTAEVTLRVAAGDLGDKFFSSNSRSDT